MNARTTVPSQSQRTSLAPTTQVSHELLNLELKREVLELKAELQRLKTQHVILILTAGTHCRSCCFAFWQPKRLPGFNVKIVSKRLLCGRARATVQRSAHRVYASTRRKVDARDCSSTRIAKQEHLAGALQGLHSGVNSIALHWNQYSRAGV